MIQRGWINTSKCALVIGGEVYVAWKRKMLHNVIGGYQAYIQRKKDLFIYLWSLEFRSWLRPHAVSRLRTRFAGDKIIKSLRSALQAELRSELLLLWLIHWLHLLIKYSAECLESFEFKMRQGYIVILALQETGKLLF